MNTKVNQQISIGGAIVFRDNRGKRYFLIVKNKDDSDWEIPNVTVRKGESSVRSAIRLINEQGGIAARVLEEAGRISGVAIINGKSIPKKHYYYLMMQKGALSEMIGFNEFKWVQYPDSTKRLGLKKEKEMLKSAVTVLKEWEKTHKIKQY